MQCHAASDAVFAASGPSAHFGAGPGGARSATIRLLRHTQRESRRLDPSQSPPLAVVAPAAQSIPLVLASPHSGSVYPESFLAASRLPVATLRRSEDCFVDDLFAAAPRAGAPLLRANFPRSYLDVNREPFELDPGMFRHRLPAYVNHRSARVRSGLGTIPRIAATGAEIYRDKLAWAEAKDRIRRFYIPYHRALNRLLAETRERFGFAILLDCHSMPSAAAESVGGRRADIVLGDCHGSSCGAEIVDAAEAYLRGRGYTTIRNRPYAGGHTTQSRGQPGAGIHALQIEINRAIYMHEERLLRTPGAATVAADMAGLIGMLGAVDLLPLAAE